MTKIDFGDTLRKLGCPSCKSHNLDVVGGANDTYSVTCKDCGNKCVMKAFKKPVSDKLLKKLNPCPFCGKKVLPEWDSDGCMHITCGNAKCLAHVTFLGSANDTATVTRWNIRMDTGIKNKVTTPETITPETELKKCPFCGNLTPNQELIVGADSPETKGRDESKVASMPTRSTAVWCSYCGALTLFDDGTGIKLTNDRWNRRTGV